MEKDPLDIFDETTKGNLDARLRCGSMMLDEEDVLGEMDPYGAKDDLQALQDANLSNLEVYDDLHNQYGAPQRPRRARNPDIRNPD